MIRSKNPVLQVLRFFCLACVIAVGFISVVATGGGNGGDGGTVSYLQLERPVASSVPLTCPHNMYHFLS
jgi:hypothetical protein